MSLRRLAWCTPLLLSLACGGDKSPSAAANPPAPMAAETAEAMATAFLLAEHQQASVTALPALAPSGEPGVYALLNGSGNLGCMTVTTDGTTIVLTFTGCMGPNGGMLTGQLSISWMANQCTLNYQNFQASKGTQAWTLNGTKTIQINTAAHQASVSVTGMTMAFSDSAAPSINKTMNYGCNLTSDWATAGTYKLWGTFHTQQGMNPVLTGTIAAATPLTWMTGCCYPGSDSLNLQQGTAQADLQFGMPCGTLTLTPFGQVGMTKTLADCP